MQRQDEKALNVSANEKTINGNLLTDEEHPFTDKSPDISGELLHIRDVNSKDIFKNNVLTSQFLKDYSGISFFSDIKPEDIEDQTSRFKLLLGIEVEGDTVKKINLRLGNNQEEIYVISLIEHKSQVDADVAMQLLLYMTVIWKDYARKCNKQKKNANKSSHFRYPLIIPIVYYEGTDKWTAGLRLSDRIAHAELAMDYVPDFTYKIIPLREYGNNELKLHNNEMSLIMMINKIQSAVDLHEFRLTALDFLKDIYGSTSTDIQKLILDVIWGLLMKIDVPEEKAEKMLQSVRKGNDMGVLFENFKTFDWKEANEKREAAEAELRTTERKLDETKALLKTAESKLETAESKLETAESKLETAESKLETAEVRLTQEKNRADQAVIKAERLERELKRLQDRQQ